MNDAAGFDPTALGFEPVPTPWGPAWWRVEDVPLGPAPAPVDARWGPALGLNHPGPRAFLDLEATGRRITASTYAFLVGLLVWQGEEGRFHQWVLPHPAAEAALWHHVAALWPAGAVLFTYNGARFDLPLLQTRAQMAGVAPGPWDDAAHVDVLPWVRRAFRGTWPDHRLTTAAARLAAMPRPADDLDAALLPELYHHALLTRAPLPLRPAQSHHRADVLALAAVWAALARELAALPPTRAYPATTWLSRGRLYAQHHDWPRARAAFQRAQTRARTPDERRQAGLRLAEVYRRLGEPDAAHALWRELAAEGVWEAYQHLIRAALRARDPNTACRWLRQAQAHLRAATTSPLERALWQPKFAALARRVQRGQGTACDAEAT